MASTADFKNGLVLQIDGQLWQIIEFQHVKPGKGPAFVRTKLKNVLSGKVVDKTYNAGVKVETATVDRRDATYLYRDGVGLRVHGRRGLRAAPAAGVAGRRRRQLPAGEHAGADRVPRRRAAVPRAAGDRRARGHPHRARACRATGPARAPSRPRVETGAEIQVPLFINTGDKLKVDSRDGSYLGRVNA